MQCVFTVSRELIVSDIAVSKTNLLVLNNEGICFEAVHKPRKGGSNETPGGSAGSSQDTSNRAKAVTSFFKFDRSQCDVLKVRQRLPGVYRGVKCSVDPKGRNFCVLQVKKTSNLNYTQSQ